MTVRAWILLLSALLLPRPASGQAYSVVDLGVGDGFFPTALNNRGQVLLTNSQLTPATIGGLLASNSPSKWVGPASVLWENGQTTPIGLLPGGTYSRGCGLNDAGQVAGFGDTLFTYPPANIAELVMHAFVWQGGGLTDLEPKMTVDPGVPIFAVFTGSFATGINNQGQVTGAMTAPAPGPADPGEGKPAVVHAFRTAPGGLIDRQADDLSAGDPTFTQGWLINNAGQVLGTRTPLGGARSYFLAGGGALPPSGAAVYAMNDSGAIVGVDGGHAFVSGAAGGLPAVSFPAESAALGINNRGEIVGQGEIGDRVHALLFTDGQVIDLDGTLPAGSGWELSEATLINDRGQIVVWGTHGGHSAFGLLTPEEISLTLGFLSGMVCSGDAAGGLLRLDHPAPAGGLLVQLSSDPPLPELPLGVTVPPGQTEKAFTVPIPGLPGTTYRITASFSSGTGLSSAEASLVVARPQLESLTLSDKEISSDDEATGTVTLSCPAAAGGTAVTLEVDDPRQLDRLSLPHTVQVAEGQTSAKFSITPKGDEVWHNEVLFTLKASAGGTSKSQELMVDPTIHNLYLAVDPVLGTTGGGPVTGTITLSLPAPAGGRAVEVTSSNPAVASVNGSASGQSLMAVVPEGQQTLDFTIQTQRVTSPAAVEITARTPTSEETRPFSVVP